MNATECNNVPGVLLVCNFEIDSSVGFSMGNPISPYKKYGVFEPKKKSMGFLSIGFRRSRKKIWGFSAKPKKKYGVFRRSRKKYGVLQPPEKKYGVFKSMFLMFLD